MASPGNVADFLLHMFQEKKCQVSTVKGYRSTISNTLKFMSGQNIGSDPIISQNGTFPVFFRLYVASLLNLCIGHQGSISPLIGTYLYS